MAVIQESDRSFLPSVPRCVIRIISRITHPTIEQQLIIDEMTQSTTPELGPELAQELAETVTEKPAPK